MGRRTPAHSAVARHSAPAAMPKQVYGDSALASTPPSDAPTTLMVPQAAPVTAMAAERSAGSTRFGTAAEAAGEANALAIATAPTPASPSQAVGRLCTANSRPTPPTAHRFAVIRIFRRSIRSATVPVYGSRNALTPVSIASVSPPARPPPVSLPSSPSSGMRTNQSPPKITSSAANSQRKSRLWVKTRSGPYSWRSLRSRGPVAPPSTPSLVATLLSPGAARHGPASRQVEGTGGGQAVHRDRDRCRGGGDRPLGVLQPVPGHRADHRRVGRYQAGLGALEQTGDAGRTGQFDEDADLAGEQPVRLEDVPVGDRLDQAAGGVPGVECLGPRGRVANPDRGRDRGRLGDHRTVHDRGGAGRLEAVHLRGPGGVPGGEVLLVPHPVRGDVAGVADRQALDVRRLSERLDDLENRRLLAVQPVRVD